MIYVFRDYALDSNRRELRRGAELIAVEPRVFDLREYLIRNRDRVVSKDDLIESVWNGRIVSESALMSRMNGARHAVGDSGEKQLLIRTVARKGYRFVGEVREVQEPAHASAEHHAEPVPPTLALPDKPSIAILPFADLSGNSDQDYFADGMVEDIIVGLSRIKWLFVIARNSSFIYKGRTIDVKQVGRELGVRYVVEGSVRRAGERVRISAQLVEAETRTHLWAERYDRLVDDIFALQDEITLSVVGAIEPSLRDAEVERVKRKRPESLDAYDLVLQAHFDVYSRMPEHAKKALVLLDCALALDLAYALAHAYAAQCHHCLYFRGGLHEDIGQLRFAMLKALSSMVRTTRLLSLSPDFPSVWRGMIRTPPLPRSRRHSRSVPHRP